MKAENNEIKQILTHGQSLIDREKINQFIEKVFSSTEENQKILLILAFSLFPRTELRHIERLVTRWHDSSPSLTSSHPGYVEE